MNEVVRHPIVIDLERDRIRLILTTDPGDPLDPSLLPEGLVDRGEEAAQRPLSLSTDHEDGHPVPVDQRVVFLGAPDRGSVTKEYLGAG